MSNAIECALTSTKNRFVAECKQRLLCSSADPATFDCVQRFFRVQHALVTVASLLLLCYVSRFVLIATISKWNCVCLCVYVCLCVSNCARINTYVAQLNLSSKHIVHNVTGVFASSHTPYMYNSEALLVSSLGFWIVFNFLQPAPARVPLRNLPIVPYSVSVCVFDFAIVYWIWSNRLAVAFCPLKMGALCWLFWCFHFHPKSMYLLLAVDMCVCFSCNSLCVLLT